MVVRRPVTKGVQGGRMDYATQRHEGTLFAWANRKLWGNKTDGWEALAGCHFYTSYSDAMDGCFRTRSKLVGPPYLRTRCRCCRRPRPISVSSEYHQSAVRLRSFAWFFPPGAPHNRWHRMRLKIFLLTLRIMSFVLFGQTQAIGVRAQSQPPAPSVAADQEMHRGEGTVDLWWNTRAGSCLLQEPTWVTFDLNTVMTDALEHSPRISAVKRRTTIAMERITQEDAAFDARVLLDSRYGRTSDPVGNTLTTGGPNRLSEQSWNNRAGMAKTARDGTRIDLSQQAGLLDSNSLFFDPAHQGNTRLSLSLTRPLRAGSGQLYNERLVLQAKIDSQLSWQEMLREIQAQVAGVMTGFWRLYEARCHLLQRRHALERGEEIAALIDGRRTLDSGGLEAAKVKSRLARRHDSVIESERNVLNQQIFLAQLVGSPSLPQGKPVELIPNAMPVCPPLTIEPRDAILTGVNYRFDVRAAALDLETAALAISISRNELLPQLDAVVSGYLAGLNGRNDVLQSFSDQLARTPGIAGGVVYERPYGNRAARSRLRSTQQRYLEMSDRYRGVISLTTAEVDMAVRQLNTLSAQLQTKTDVLIAVTRQESMVRQRWLTMGSDGRYAALVLEDVLEQQEARTAAEIEYVSVHVAYLLALVELQRAMGTLLQAEGIDLHGDGDNSAAAAIFPAGGAALPAASEQPAAAAPEPLVLVADQRQQPLASGSAAGNPPPLQRELQHPHTAGGDGRPRRLGGGLQR